MRLVLDKCRTVFFDLEFYVSPDAREREGFKYNPWCDECFLIGGAFLNVNPTAGTKKEEQWLDGAVSTYWCWDYNFDEKILINKITEYLVSISDLVKRHNPSASPVLCGINISHSDVPILFELIKKHNVLSNQDAFSLMNSFRTIDLSVYSTGAFKSPSMFVYPQRKNAIMGKFFPGKVFESGSSVWDLWDEKKYSDIEGRVMDEVLHTYESLKKIRNYYNRAKIAHDKEKSLEKKMLRSESVKDRP